MGVRAEETPEWAVVHDPATPTADLILLICSPWWAIRRAALARIPAEDLPRLWQHPYVKGARLSPPHMDSLAWEIITRARAGALPDPVAQHFLTNGLLHNVDWARRVTRCYFDKDDIPRLSTILIDAYIDYPDVWVQVNLAENPKLPEPYLERLAVGTPVLVRERLARCAVTGPVLRLLAASTAEAVWKALSTMHGDWFVGNADATLVARYASRTPRKDHLWQLAIHPDPAVRAAVAGNTLGGMDLAARLLTDPDPAVRLAAVQAGWTYPTDTVLRLLNDPDPRVRRATVKAHGAWLSWPQVAHLLNDPDPHVRANLMRVSGIPMGALNALAADPHATVRRAASTRLLTAV